MKRDFAPVSVVVNNVEVLVTQKTNPAKDAAEFVAATKKRAEPTPWIVGHRQHLRTWPSSSCPEADRRKAPCTSPTKARRRPSPT